MECHHRPTASHQEKASTTIVWWGIDRDTQTDGRTDGRGWVRAQWAEKHTDMPTCRDSFPGGGFQPPWFLLYAHSLKWADLPMIVMKIGLAPSIQKSDGRLPQRGPHASGPRSRASSGKSQLKTCFHKNITIDTWTLEKDIRYWNQCEQMHSVYLYHNSSGHIVIAEYTAMTITNIGQQSETVTVRPQKIGFLRNLWDVNHILLTY